MIFAAVQSFLWLATFSVASVYYANEYSVSQTFLSNLEVPEGLNWLLFYAIIGVSIGITVFHVITGGIMGSAAGGVLNGMQLGLIVGVVQAVGRLWSYCFAIAGASFFFNEESWWHALLFIVVGLVFLSVKRLSDYIAHSTG